MHYNFYLLRALARELDSRLVGYRFVACFSQEKDELMLGMSNGEADFWLRATLTGRFQCLSFPHDFFRAKRNSVNLFDSLLEKSVLRVRVAKNERSLLFELAGGLLLVFKMHGRQANILLFEDGEVREIFHQKFAQDYELVPESLDRPIDQSREAFLREGLQATFPTFGKKLRQHLDLQPEDSPETQWETISQLLQRLQNPIFFVTLRDELPELLLFEDGKVLARTESPTEALNCFYQEWTGRFYLQEAQKTALRKVDKRLRQTKNYLQKAWHKLEEVTGEQRYEEIGHIIMANLHQIPKGAKKVELFDFYRNEPIQIKLRKELSAADNAATFYRKAKNQHIEEKTLQENIEGKEKLREKLEGIREQILSFDKVRELRKFLKTHKLDEKSHRQARPEIPFRAFSFKGYTIWVGKNSKNNDLLTQSYAQKDDLWLHVRSAGGSHVVVRNPMRKTVPQDVIERAAQLAAYYSKRKSEGLCPVIYTPKKYVRKPKGAAPGAVVVEKEQVLMVEPKL